MTSGFWALMLVVTANALLFHLIPRLSRPDILFGVTVSEAYVAGVGRTLVSRYRMTVWAGAAAALAILLLLQSPQDDSGRGAMLMTGVMTGSIVFAHVAWQLARQKARAHALPPSDVRVASLVTRDTSLPGGALFAAGPFAILLATALLRYAYLDEVPDGPDTANPFGQLVFGAVFVAMMLTMAVTLARRSRQIAADGPAASAEQRFRRVNILGLVLAAYAAAILLSAVTVKSIPGFGDTLSGRGWFVLVPLMLLNFGVTVWMLRVGQGGLRAVAPAARREVHGDATPDHAWIFGMYYVNPRDPAMWVENRFGLGYTLNFGNWRAWLLIVAMMLFPMFAGRLLF
ncbi:MAG TPA: DUF5808 domain-containing protein [Vicinamibacterales bacterium]|nr:DUF5808 domain-containing protein [Vicinamibacterales bacterium]